MAKTYINTVKYEIKMKFEIDGIVDKPDIIGAIFGQSEGLLGDEMDLKELQKNGKVGRIEINHSTSMGRTKGDVVVPSSMDMAETSILAAGIESVDKVGPCAAKFEIADIADTRSSKRDEIKDRAKELFKRMMEKSKPEVQSISEEIRENARAADITEYGPDKLPAGPNIDESDEIIVVEGRADVLNLLRNQIRNVIGMNGSNISSTIVRLSREKLITAFIDGDRGGLLNARKLCQIARVQFIAKAPDGKEVEELTRKEILQSLKRAVAPTEVFSEDRPFEQRRFERWEARGSMEGATGGRAFGHTERTEVGGTEDGMPGAGSRGFGEAIAPYERSRMGIGRPMRGGMGFGRGRGPGMRGGRGMWDGIDRPQRFPRQGFGMEMRGAPRRPAQERMAFNIDDPVAEAGAQVPAASLLTREEEERFRPMVEELKGSMKARILGVDNAVMKEVKVKDVVAEIGKAKNAHAVVLDGVVTKRLVDAAEKAGAKFVVGCRKGKIENNPKVKAVAI